MFVWQHKRPLVSFDQLCLPIAKGGLGVLNPQLQHPVLQVRHFRHIFNHSTIPSLVQDVAKHHLSIIADNDHFSLVSFFAPVFWQHGYNHLWFIIHTI